ncbi:MAG TPA: protein-methionine-sulfoxide reductase heme-binding subunit MsrQ [Pyrinomonadaceae bacterium]|nr:protein-methionine-sulfoxide reductase heme-binding subunit MsrQ [Pyrinomonadaceae bacterium]
MATETIKGLTVDVKFARFLVFVNALVPLALLLWDGYHHRLGANPPEFATRATGVLALVFILITLAVTPLRKLTGASWLAKFRRMLGLYAFFYACLHLLAYSLFDKAFAASEVLRDVAARPFIAVGMASFLLLIPLAATSTAGMIRRLGGRRWARLHKLTYVAAVGGVVHYWMLVKADTRVPLAFAAALAALLGYRLFAARRDARRRRRAAVAAD